MLLQALRVAAVALVTIAATSVASAESITAAATTNNGSGGVFIDLTPVGGALNFTAFTTFFSSAAGTPVNVEVWTKNGTYVGFTTSNAGWTLSETVTGTSAGAAVLSTPVSLTSPILLSAGTTTAIYLHAVTTGGGIRYNGTGALPPVQTYSNADITLFSNVARTGIVAFAGAQNTPRTFAGTIEYTPSNVNAMGACCTATALCTFGSPADCTTSGGFFSGDGTSCSPNVCPHRGACCSTLTNACTFSNNGAAGCGANTTYQGDATTCNPNICPQGACCNDTTGVCSLTAPTGCLAGSTFQSNGTTCTVNPCPQPPPPANDECTAAIALTLNVALIGTNAQATGDGTEGPGGACYATSPQTFNRAVWFTFTAPASDVFGVTTCGSAFDCVVSVYDGTCASPGAELGCDDDTCDGITPPGSGLASIIAPFGMTAGQTYLIRLAAWNVGVGGAFTITVTGTAPAGVCCRGATCSTTITDSAACSASLIGGQLAGASFPAAASCNAGAVSNSPCCYADYNKVGGISVGDIFDFLGDWFAGSPYANTGGNGSAGPLAVQNIFDFLTNWFTGGC